jgi:hypothetical protein
MVLAVSLTAGFRLASQLQKEVPLTAFLFARR